VCAEPISTLRSSTQGALITFLSDDGSDPILLTQGHEVPFFGETHDLFWLNANGNITFDASDNSWEGIAPVHFSRPRAAAMLVDFNPLQGGKVYQQELDDRFVATWENIQEFEQSDSSTFQIELFYDGRIRVSYLQMQADFGVAGLSRGPGPIELDTYSDLSAYGECFVAPYITGRSFVEVGANVTLQLVTAGLDQPVSYSWTHNGAPAGGNSDTLTISGVMPSDDGVYRATVSDGSKGSFQTPPFYLHVVQEVPAGGAAGLIVLAVLIGASIAARKR
jgi:hypothetical protein